MTTLSPSSSNQSAPPPADKPAVGSPDASININLAQLASRSESKHTSTTKSPQHDAPAYASDEISIRQMLPPPPTSKSFSTLDETALFYYGSDFAHLDSEPITRVASMSPEELFKAEIDLESNGNDHYNRLDRPSSGEKATTHRHRASSAPQKPTDLSTVSRKFEMHSFTTIHCSGVVAGNKAEMAKPTAQEWVADIDCVSDIFGAMLADGDRVGPFI